MSKRTNATIIHGRHPVVDAIRAGQPFDKIILQQGVRGDFEKELRQLTKSHGIPLQVVPKERLSRYSRGNHQGVIGFLSLMPYYRLSDVLPGIFEKSETPLIVLLDGVTDVRNFGAIARSAEVFG
ncbi:MAG: 23S rRNA (guanosine(2251)-2'-O)-methyltransferase RlmB, partial [Bacteroidetes bacterium]